MVGWHARSRCELLHCSVRQTQIKQHLMQRANQYGVSIVCGFELSTMKVSRECYGGVMLYYRHAFIEVNGIRVLVPHEAPLTHFPARHLIVCVVL
jgi:hypothetical protein